MKKWEFDLKRSLFAQVELQLILLGFKLLTSGDTTNFPWSLVLLPVWVVLIVFFLFFFYGLYLIIMSPKDIDNDR